MCRIPPAPCFCTKSLQAVENKGWECGKEPQERTRVRNWLIMKRIGWRGRQVDVVVLRKSCLGGTPGGNADVFEYKGFAGKGIRKTMKTKGDNLGIFGLNCSHLAFGRKRLAGGLAAGAR